MLSGSTIIILSCLTVFLWFCISSLLGFNVLFGTLGRPRRLKLLYRQETDAGCWVDCGGGLFRGGPRGSHLVTVRSGSLTCSRLMPAVCSRMSLLHDGSSVLLRGDVEEDSRKQHCPKLASLWVLGFFFWFFFFFFCLFAISWAAPVAHGDSQARG